jgi:hypothetical protein
MMSEIEKGELLYQEDREKFFWRWTGFFVLSIILYILFSITLYLLIIEGKYSGIFVVVAGLIISSATMWLSIKMKRGIIFSNGIEIENIKPLWLIRKKIFIDYRNIKKIIYPGYGRVKCILLLKTNMEIIVDRDFISEKTFNIILSQISKLSNKYNIDLIDFNWQ